MSALEDMVGGEAVNLILSFLHVSSNVPCNMFHKLQIGNMTWLQLKKTFQSKDFFALFHAFVAARKAGDDQARRRKGKNCNKLRK